MARCKIWLLHSWNISVQFDLLEFNLRVLCLLSGDQGNTATVGYELSDKFGEVPRKKLWISAEY